MLYIVCTYNLDLRFCLCEYQNIQLTIKPNLCAQQLRSERLFLLSKKKSILSLCMS